MPWRKPIAALLACYVVVLASAALAADPTVYVFWGKTCPVSQKAMAFVGKLRSEEPSLPIRDFEVEDSIKNAAFHERVLERIGMAGVSIVPVVIVGSNVLIGFESEEVSGTRIREFVRLCRTESCADRIFDLLPDAGPDVPLTALAPNARTCATASQSLRIEASR